MKKSIRLLAVLLASAMLLALVPFGVSAAETNVALGKTYTNDINTGDLAYNTSYGAKLTDGNASDVFDMGNGLDDFGSMIDDTWYLFSMYSTNVTDGVGTTVIDLGAEYALTGVRLHLANVAGMPVVAPTAINVYVSDDNTDFGNAVVTVPVQTDANIVYWTEADIASGISGRYVKFEFVIPTGLAYVNEIEIYGTESTPSENNGTNAALNKTYTNDINTGDSQYNTSYGAKLTDGVAATTFDSTNDSWYLFNANSTNVSGGIGTTVVDLGSSISISSVRIHIATAQTVMFVDAPTSIRIYVSETQTFGTTPDATITPENKTDSCYWVETALSNVTGRYVKFEFVLSGGSYGLVNEIEIHTNGDVPVTGDSNNVAFGKTYTNNVNTGDAQYGTSYGAKLTDGVAAAAFDSTNDSWYCFSGYYTGTPNVVNGVGSTVIDLGQVYDLSKVKIHIATAQTVMGVNAPASIKVYASETETFGTTPDATITPENKTDSCYWVEAALTDVKGRYVKFEFALSASWPFGYVNEIEVYKVSEGSSAETETNLALQQTYTNNVNTGDAQYGTSYGAKLTDGVAAATFDSTNDSWYCFSGYYTGTPNVVNGVGSTVIDLGVNADLSKVKIHIATAQTVMGVNAPASIKVYASETETFGTAPDATITPENKTDSCYWVETALIEVKGRYVKLEFALSGAFAYVNEIEVYGVKTAGSDEGDNGSHTCSVPDGVKWETGVTQHWHLCSCGEELDKENHKDGEWVTVKPAEIGAEGRKELYCAVCGYMLAYETLAPLTETTPDPEPTPNPEPNPDPEPEFEIGDVNMNGKLDARDYLLLKRAFFKTFTLQCADEIADINGNGKLDARDYLLLKRAFFGTYEIK